MEYMIPGNYYRDDLDSREVMVTIHCLTYNHEKYIADALEGFVSQKTDFRFEAVVHDDASTDGTAAIIREYAQKYPSIIKPIFETENQYRKPDGSLGRIMSQHIRGKYVAYCEGDDYWTDPLKLQKQVDLMEQNPSATGCYTSFITIDTNGKKIKRPFSDHIIQLSHSGEQFGDLIKTNYIQTCTFLCKSSLLTTDVYQNCPSHMDYSLFLSAAISGPLIYIPETTAAYRIVPTGMIATKLSYVGQLARSIQYYFWGIAYRDNNHIIHKSEYVRYFWQNAWSQKHMPISLMKIMKIAPFAAIGGLLLWLVMFLRNVIIKYACRLSWYRRNN